ncbi:putative mRNA 3-end processing factor [Halopseudomonas sabulinigri]|uniref:Putative mRNA 3-end processing factor n=1 Tax=Halopseudomonas sabulinigri TaxID=472181 RepID=A0A1H1TAX4_9GAMM|nr:ligase-associated DNA damage response exonuclease [Halopseudomonas sabulinigri]SDS57417.1 putative mRNA 3-end processing factor [Halopseudomonas sabulinigri]
MLDPLIIPTDEGLFCPAGNFHIDPWRPVVTAVITHAHADHARSGHQLYYAHQASVPILRHRLGEHELIGLPYGEQRRFGPTTLSLHSAGHVLGSAQVRVAHDDGRVWVVSGDYKRDADPTCAPFEVVPCDTLITEATFALPCYRWPPVEQVGRQMWQWWQSNPERPCILFTYAFGKAQRVLAALAEHTDRTVYLHGAMVALTELYRDAGVAMLPTQPVSELPRDASFNGQLILAPPSAAGSRWMRRFKNASTGFASGWMRIRGNRRRRGYDQGFELSDHADWPALLATIRDCGASTVLTTHGRSDDLVRYLREHEGVDARALTTLYGAEDD